MNFDPHLLSFCFYQLASLQCSHQAQFKGTVFSSIVASLSESGLQQRPLHHAALLLLTLTQSGLYLPSCARLSVPQPDPVSLRSRRGGTADLGSWRSVAWPQLNADLMLSLKSFCRGLAQKSVRLQRPVDSHEDPNQQR